MNPVMAKTRMERLRIDSAGGDAGAKIERSWFIRSPSLDVPPGPQFPPSAVPGRCVASSLYTVFPERLHAGPLRRRARGVWRGVNSSGPCPGNWEQPYGRAKMPKIDASATTHIIV